ncbi:DUF6588 family protein [Mesonia maritima]|uniref:Outer membrane protein beta-barrel domain-containing protein n=1 Tax=Mesonia maritima TaxID=1793873 RepID=A0ABU1K8V1_9FLAO|nr:DUF6588 family protein [Mesonia maritima]MDR6302021.1 hypothetical protein [Mesonia maritima]
MKKILLLSLLLLSQFISAQTNIGELVTYAIEDITRFGNAFINPAAKGVMYNVNNGWYNTAESKKFLEFEIAVTGNLTFVQRDENSFPVNVNDYNNIRFEDEAIAKQVATIFGRNNPDIKVFLDYTTPDGEESVEVLLPQGIDEGQVKSVPNVFLQGSVGLVKATELKFRYAPEVNYGDVKKQLYGAGIQHEFTSWLKEDNTFPLKIAGLLGYTNFKGFFDLKESGEQNSDQGIDSEMDTWTFSLISSTEFEMLNFYAGIGYLTAKSETKFKGVYKIAEEDEIFQDLLNNYSVTNKVHGFNATIGARLSIDNFRINTAFNIQEFYNLTVGFAYVFNSN